MMRSWPILPLLLWWFVSFFDYDGPKLYGPFQTVEECDEGREALIMLAAHRAHPERAPTLKAIRRATKRISDCKEPPFD